MANNKTNKVTMDFNNASLCLDRNEAQIRQFNVFNNRNAPLYGGALAPYYTKTKSYSSDSSVHIDSKGNVWGVSGRYLTKNGERITANTISQYYASQEEVANHYIYSATDYDDVGMIECYQDSDTQHWIIDKSGTTLDLGRYTGDVITTFVKIPPTETQAMYLFVAWYYLTGRVYIQWVDALAMSVTYSIDTGISSHLRFSTNRINNPFINAGVIGINNAQSDYIGISLFPESGSKITPIRPIANIIVSRVPDSTNTLQIIWDQDTTGGSSNIQLSKGSAITDTNVKLYNSFGFFPSQMVGDTYMGKSTYIYTPCYLGSYDIITSGVQATDYPIFQGPCTITSSSYSSSKLTLTIGSMYYYYDTAVLAKGSLTQSDLDSMYSSESSARPVIAASSSTSNTSNVANSFTLYPSYYKQFAAVWKSGTSQNTFLTMEFDSTAMYYGRGVSMGSGETPETMSYVYNGMGDAIEQIHVSSFYKIMLNEGEISGIGGKYYDELYTPMFDIDTSEFPCIGGGSSHSGGNCYYLSTNGKRYKLSYSSANVNGVKCIVDDRYIVLFSGEIYDSIADKFYYINPGYNNYVYSGVAATRNTLLSSDYVEAYATGRDTYLTLIVSSINNHYEVSGEPVIGTQWAVQRLYGFLNLNTQCENNNPYQNVDLYMAISTQSTVPYYVNSFARVVNRQYNSTLQGLTYSYDVNNPIYALSQFFYYIESYNRSDFIVEGGKGYPIIYSNNAIKFAYTALNFIENVSSIFVIQGTVYMVVESYILRVTFANNQIQSTEVVTKTEGLTFCGACLKYALFFSPVKKSFFIFTGDVVMNEIVQANAISVINYATYLQALDDIILSVTEYSGNNFLYFFKNGIFTFKIPIEELADRIITSQNSSIYIHYVDNTIEEFSMEYDSSATKHSVQLQTAFFGAGSENSQILDCWYFRLFSDDLPVGGKFTATQKTLTNQGVASQTKTVTITSGMFDPLTRTLLIRFQPRYQAAVGFSLEVESDYPLYEITASFTPDTTQVSKVNI